MPRLFLGRRSLLGIRELLGALFFGGATGVCQLAIATRLFSPGICDDDDDDDDQPFSFLPSSSRYSSSSSFLAACVHTCHVRSCDDIPKMVEEFPDL